MEKKRLLKYAETIVKIGANVRKGQDVWINADVDQAEFVSYVVEAAYKAKAKSVTVNWGYPKLTVLNSKYLSSKELGSLKNYELSKFEYARDNLPVRIHLVSRDPNALKGANQKKLAEGNKAIYPIIKPITDAMSDKYQWTIAAIPSAKWAKLVFPNLSKGKAVEALWEQILACARITDDPIDAWNKHNAYLEEKANTLTSLDIDYLHYTNSLGTNFKVWLLENTHFIAGGEYAKDSNIFYNPNMPTEECFTSPKKGAAEGIVYASKPLSYMGELIEEFSVKFENGRAVEVKALKGTELLQQLISMDEGASYLGEVALVPYDSPVSKSNILFYNTLFDENAACHLALGMGFTNVYNDYEKYTKQEINDKGINDSMVHVDFMIGTPDLSIVGYTRKGEKIQVFKDGNWAI